jgi:hypothetical protein
MIHGCLTPRQATDSGSSTYLVTRAFGINTDASAISSRRSPCHATERRLHPNVIKRESRVRMEVEFLKKAARALTEAAALRPKYFDHWARVKPTAG